MPNEFSGPESYDHEIVEVNAQGKRVKVGEIRIKPNRVMWKAKGKHGWKGISLADFANWMEQNGEAQDK